MTIPLFSTCFFFNFCRCFITPNGYKLLIADLSNIELLILAEVSGDIIMQRFFAEGKDLTARQRWQDFGRGTSG